MKVKNGSEPVPGTPKVPNWYLRFFGLGNSVPVPSIICSSPTTGFIRTTLLPYNFFGCFSFGYLLVFFLYFLFFFLSAVSVRNALVVISKHL
ncbi:hypothetical protein HanPI659440_Chr14g0547961 [Helianthus annuus]|nr:hypothetical protein HanPI659440_Chr14g0547961 [Helianthus annuus]